MLDIRTLITVLALDALVFCVCLFAVRGRKLYDGQQSWGIGLLFQAAGFALFALPLDTSTHGVFSFGSLLISASCSAYVFAMYGFARKKPPRLALILTPLLLGASELVWADNFLARGLCANLLIGLQLAFAAWPLLRHVHDVSPQLRWVVSASFLLSALATLARFAELVFAPADLPDLRVAEPVNAMAFLVNHANLLFGNLGIALMHRERTRAEADRLSTRDPLTELLNRRSITALVDRELLRFQRSGDALALLMVSVDDFREINNHFGQLAGDRVLRQFARLLNTALRGQDLAGRYSSTEFCVLLPETDTQGARTVAEKLQKAVAAAQIGPDGVRYTISAGIAESVPGETSAAVILARADDALRRARHKGYANIETGGIE